jgi:hypothetical protein
MSIVYVTQIPSRIENSAWIPTVDVSPAKIFGHLDVMLPSGMNYSDASSVVDQLRGKLKNFDPDSDYLLSLGDPVVVSVASALIGYEHDYFRLLKWDRQQRRYIPYEVKLYGRK